MSCGVQLKPEKKKRAHVEGGVPSMVEMCWSCFATMSAYQRALIVIAVRDRLVGGVLSELAAAIDRLDQSRDDDDGDTWKLSE
jgi:hypothetical protein